MLVASFNIELFKEMAKRWAIDWRRKISVDESNEKELFKQIWDLFLSNIDANESNVAVKLTMEECIESIKTQFQI